MLFDDAVLIGKVIKSRSAKGDVQINLSGITSDMYDGEFLIIDIDGLKTPFKIESLDERGNTLLVKFKESEGNSDEIIGCNVYARKEDLREYDEDDATMHPQMLIGFEVYDTKLGKLGKIVEVDTATVNTVITVRGEKEILVPLAEELVEDFDVSSKTITLSLPDGLMTLNDTKAADPKR